jgi:nitroreductase
MDLGTVTVGAFHDEQVKEVLNLPEDEQPLYILPVRKKVNMRYRARTLNYL